MASVITYLCKHSSNKSLVVLLPKAFLTPADSFSADIFTAAYDDRVNPEVYVFNGPNGGVDSVLLAKGETDINKLMKGTKGTKWGDGDWYQMSEEDVKAGKGNLKIKPSMGVNNWGGLIKLKTKKGPKVYDFTSSFEVGSPTLLNNEQDGMAVMSYSGTNGESHSFNMIEDIRTVFWVISEDPSVSSSDLRYLLGDSTKEPDWHNNGDGNIWGTTFGDSKVFNGYTRLNGSVIDGKQTSKPNILSIISLRTLGNVQSDNFSNDRILGRRLCPQSRNCSCLG